MRYYILVGLILFANISSGQVYDFVVDAQGTGDFSTIGEALSSVPDNQSQRTLILVKNGTYQEKLILTSSKSSVSLIGEDVENVIITWSDYQGKEGISGANSYTFLAEGDDFYMENITVVNDYGPGAQAVAIRTTGDRQVFKNCVFKGNQDTYYAHKNRQYNYKCRIEGNTDFIYGDATVVFDSCEIHSLSGGQYISAPADSKMITYLSTGPFIHGFLFSNCVLTAATDVADRSVFLGRPWQPNASAAYINCILGNHINLAGWSQWSGNNNHTSAIFSEYLNKNPDGSLVDVTQRVSWSSQLTKEEATIYYLSNFFLRKGTVNWLAKKSATALHAPLNIVVDNMNLSWSKVEEALGYAIYEENRLVEVVSTNSYLASESIPDVSAYKVITINEYGAMSDGSEELPGSTSISPISNDLEMFKMESGKIAFRRTVDVIIYNLSGQIILKEERVDYLETRNISQGVYLLTFTTEEGQVYTNKVILGN